MQTSGSISDHETEDSWTETSEGSQVRERNIRTKTKPVPDTFAPAESLLNNLGQEKPFEPIKKTEDLDQPDSLDDSTLDRSVRFI